MCGDHPVLVTGSSTQRNADADDNNEADIAVNVDDDGDEADDGDAATDDNDDDETMMRW